MEGWSLVWEDCLTDVVMVHVRPRMFIETLALLLRILNKCANQNKYKLSSFFLNKTYVHGLLSFTSKKVSMRIYNSLYNFF